MKSLIVDWTNSLGGVFAGGHFHMTGGLIALIVIVLTVLSARFVLGGSISPMEGASSLLTAVIVLTACILALREYHPTVTRPAAAPAPAPKPTVIHTTVVQHVASHPALSGWEIVTIVIAALVIGLVMFLNSKTSD